MGIIKYDKDSETFYDPTLAGVSPVQKAIVTDELWVKAAVLTARTVGMQKYFKTMLDVLRAKLGGKPKVERPNRLDICSCGSGKKFGKCCSALYEVGNPEECLSSKHLWGEWKKIELSGRYFRTCARCNGLDTVHDACELTLKDDLKVLSLGCETCKTVVVDFDVISSIIQAFKEKSSCAACGLPFASKRVIVGHVKKTEGCSLEVVDEESSVEDFFDLSSEGALDGQSVGVHGECFKKILPFWDRVHSKPGIRKSMERPILMSEGEA